MNEASLIHNSGSNVSVPLTLRRTVHVTQRQTDVNTNIFEDEVCFPAVTVTRGIAELQFTNLMSSTNHL
jgi:hypothetical protein